MSRPSDRRIIFQDYETSNWARDPIAKSYYWHRFYSHQSDLKERAARVDANGVPGTAGRPAPRSFVCATYPRTFLSSPRLASAEQTNSSLVYGDKLMLKIFRAIEEGPSLELEIGQFLATREPPYRGAPRLAGALEFTVTEREPSTLGVLFEYAPSQGDAWRYTLDALDHYYDAVLSTSGSTLQGL
jgi:predicted trehalose synthase